jgi:hypothetical protein
MKKEELKSKSSEQLETELKTIKMLTGALIGVLTVLIAVTIYGLITKEDNTTFIALIAVAISCSAILPLQFSSMKKIKTELKLRESTN